MSSYILQKDIGMANVVEVAIEKIDEVKSRLGRQVFLVICQFLNLKYLPEHWALLCVFAT
jgi:hypothetical protein